MVLDKLLKQENVFKGREQKNNNHYCEDWH